VREGRTTVEEVMRVTKDEQGGAEGVSAVDVTPEHAGK